MVGILTKTKRSAMSAGKAVSYLSNLPFLV